MQVYKWATLGAGMIFILVVAAYLNAQHLYYMAAILLTLPAVSYAAGWYAMRGLAFTRELPEAGWAGEEGALVYVAENRTRMPRFFLSVNEPLPEWVEPLDSEPPLFNVDGASGPLPEDVGVARVRHRVRYQKRGAYALRDFEVVAIDPLGVFAFTGRVPGDGEIVVYPQPEALSAFTLSGADGYGWQEFTAAALRGASVDPDGVREYAQGDPLRHIHWRQTARTGKLAVIEFEEPRTVNLVIALDLERGRNMGEGANTTLEKAVSLAASLAKQAIQAGASLRLVLPEDAATNDSARASFAAAAVSDRGQEHLLAILDALARAEAESSQSISRLVTESVGVLLPGTTLAIITSNADTALADAIIRYTSAQTRVGVVFVDPAAFVQKSSRSDAAAADAFFTEILSVRAHPFLLHHASEDEQTPETLLHGSL
ncbi:MAG TPA: DUF58 domain-containing protein [Chthonomonadaceae bacterium]|nr:DUF58 domain-containing protein [Chthonomonadaceae bacterium]